MPVSGHLTLIIGPMFSGKTTELLRRLRRHTVAGRRVVLFKYDADTRYAQEAVCTHDGVQMESKTFAQLYSMTDTELCTYHVVGIDEVQFLKSQTYIFDLLNRLHLSVVVAGLDADFRRAPFPITTELVPQAETVLKLCAVCTGCGGDAAFSKRTTSETDTEVIGGAEKYTAVCRGCYASSVTLTSY